MTIFTARTKKMQLEISQCSECGNDLPIVNRKYCLCDNCNFKRTHNGRSKEEVYSERASKRTIKPYTFKTMAKSSSHSTSNAKKHSSKVTLSTVSTEKRYHCSDGTLVSQAEINRNLKAVKDYIKHSREPVCQGSGRWDVPLSNSHTISVQRCKDMGKTELIWDEDNIELEGFEAPTSRPIMAHNIWSDGSWQQRVQLLNWNRKIEYIYKHDREQYRRIQGELGLRGLEEYCRVGESV